MNFKLVFHLANFVFPLYGVIIIQNCINLPANLSTEGNKTAVSGKLATLSCQVSPSEGVKQVHWKKTEEQGDTRDVAVNSKDGKPVIEEPFKDRVMLSSGISQTNLYIEPVRVEDEGCYTCEFAYYDDMESASACLAVYGMDIGKWLFAV